MSRPLPQHVPASVVLGCPAGMSPLGKPRRKECFSTSLEDGEYLMGEELHLLCFRHLRVIVSHLGLARDFADVASQEHGVGPMLPPHQCSCVPFSR